MSQQNNLDGAYGFLTGN